MNRRYFIIDLPHVNMSHTLDVCIGEHATQRYSLDGNKLLVKATQENIDNKVNGEGIPFTTVFPPGITTEYTDINLLLTELSTSTWMEELVI
jgi:hypothetical protein